MDAPQLLQAVGLAAGFFLTMAVWQGRGGSRETVLLPLVLAAPLIFAGGKAWYLIEQGTAPTVSNLLEPGYSLYGSLALVLLFWFAWSRLRPFPLLRFLDTVTPAAAVGLVFGRLACHLRGCCAGVPTGSAGWGIRLGPGSELFPTCVERGWTETALQTVPLHPVPLYEAGFALAAVPLLWKLQHRHPRAGTAFWAGMAGYGIFRFLIEPLRLQTVFIPGPLTLAQWVSAVALVTASAALTGRIFAGRGVATPPSPFAQE